MRIGFDIDDTLTNNEYYAQKFFTDYIKKNRLRFKLINPDTNLLTKMFDWSKDEFDIIWNKVGYQFLSNVPVVKDAVKTVNLLKAAGHEIYIITQRYSLNPYEISKKWLEDNNISYDVLIVNAKDKINACKDNFIDFYIDDRFSTCDNLNKNGIKTYAINTYFNGGEFCTSPRVNSLTEYAQIVLGKKNEENRELG